jgi:hypothetical protein
VAQVLGLRIGELETARLGNDADRGFDRIRTNSWGFSPGNYTFNSYSRTALVLRTLEALAGEDTVARALRTYHERWRFAHPSSDDFFATPELQPFRSYFAQTVESPAIVDYEIASVASEPLHPPVGRVEVDGRTVTVTEEEAGRKQAEARRQGRETWRSTVLVRRRGDIVLPTELELRYAGGRRERLPLRDDDGAPWSGRWRKVQLTGPDRLVAAALDPDDRLVLDANRLNDARRVEPDSRAADAWGARWIFWLQQLLALAGL